MDRPARTDFDRITLRRVEVADHPALAAMLERCSLTSRYGRFLGPLRQWPAGHLDAVTAPDSAVEGWVAVLDDDRAERQVLALASLHQHGPGEAELAVLVEDGWQHRGVGTRLLLLLEEAARCQGMTTLDAVVLSEHAHVLRLLQAIFGPCQMSQETGTTSVTIPLAPAGSRLQSAGVANTMTLER